jgi:hypothetical protein
MVEEVLQQKCQDLHGCWGLQSLATGATTMLSHCDNAGRVGESSPDNGSEGDNGTQRSRSVVTAEAQRTLQHTQTTDESPHGIAGLLTKLQVNARGSDLTRMATHVDEWSNWWFDGGVFDMNSRTSSQGGGRQLSRMPSQCSCQACQGAAQTQDNHLRCTHTTLSSLSVEFHTVI